MELTNDISNDLKKLDKYFKENTIISSLNVLFALSAADSPKRPDFYLKDTELTVRTPLGIKLI